jgi:hypothetical protein
VTFRTSLCRSFSGALLSLSLSAGQALADNASTEPVFTPVKFGKTSFYANKDVLNKIGPIAPILTRIAGQDIVFLDPKNTPRITLDEWAKIPAVQNLWTAKLSGGAGALFFAPHLSDWQGGTLLREFQERVDNLKTVPGFFASNIGTGKEGFGCFLLGDPNTDTNAFAQEIGAIPDSLVTDKFRQYFSDSFSLLFYALGHEAGHCPQNYNVREQVVSLGPLVTGRKTLEFEMDADSTSAKFYAETVTQKPDLKLDPDIPGKIQKLRVLAPFLAQSADSASYFSNFARYLGHATGLTPSNDTPAAEKALSSITSTIHTNFLIRATLYEVEAFGLTGQKPQPPLGRLNFVWHSIQNHPENLYYAAKALHNAAKSNKIDLPNATREGLQAFCDAWEQVGLFQNAEKVSAYEATFEKAVLQKGGIQALSLLNDLLSPQKISSFSPVYRSQNL